MIDTGTMILCFMLGLFIIFFVKKFTSQIALPGPNGLPLVGNVFQMDSLRPHVTLSKWAKHFGDVYKIRVFGKPVVVINGEKYIHEVLIKKSKDFGDREISFRLAYVYPNRQSLEKSVVNGSYSNKDWQAVKKIMTRTMRMYGDGLKHLEVITNDIIIELIQLWKGKAGQSFNPRDDIMSCVFNIMLVLLAGYKLPHGSPEITEFLNRIKSTENFDPTSGYELDLFPWLRFFGHPRIKKLDYHKFVTETAVQKIIEENKASFDPSKPRGILDSLHIIQSTSEGPSQSITDINIPTLINEQFSAGTQTTSSTLLSLIALCVVHQDFQVRLQSNIKKVIQGRQPVLEDKPKLPLVEATIFEVLRLMSIVPVTIPHIASNDTSICGASIPKGTMLWPNLWGLHHDERYWDDPWMFNPDRFLDDSGQLIPPDHPNRKRLLSFGAGIRVCLGETLAKNRLFLFVASVFQHFKFLPADSPPNCDPKEQENGVVLFLKPFDIIVESVM